MAENHKSSQSENIVLLKLWTRVVNHSLGASSTSEQYLLGLYFQFLLLCHTFRNEKMSRPKSGTHVFFVDVCVHKFVFLGIFEFDVIFVQEARLYRLKFVL